MKPKASKFKISIQISDDMIRSKQKTYKSHVPPVYTNDDKYNSRRMCYYKYINYRLHVNILIPSKAPQCLMPYFHFTTSWLALGVINRTSNCNTREQNLGNQLEHSLEDLHPFARFTRLSHQALQS